MTPQEARLRAERDAARRQYENLLRAGQDQTNAFDECRAERDRLREALAEDRDKWGFDTLLMVGDLLLERVYPEGVPLISEGDDPGPRLVRAVRDCRAALSEQEGGEPA